MKKFKFTLQTVHNVREMRQEKEQLVLMQIQTEINLAAEKIVHIEKMRFDALESYTKRLTAGAVVNAVELELASNHFTSLDRLQREAEQILQEKKQAYNNQTGKVASAVRQVKITNKLRENQQARYKSELANHEQNNLDEITSANYARRIIQTND